MKSPFKFIKYYILISIIYSIPSFSQDSSKIILLSKYIGPVVDVSEKLEYNILPHFKEDFISAIYYQNTDSQYCCMVRLKGDNNSADSIFTFNLTFNSIRNTAFRVQYIDNLNRGNANFNIENVELVFANNEEVRNLVATDEKIELENKNADPKTNKFLFVKNLPLADIEVDYSQFVERDTYFGFTIGILYNTSRFDGLAGVYNILEDNISSPEYEIPKSNLIFSTFPIFNFSSFILITDKFIIDLQYGFNINSNSQQYFDYYTFLASFGYLIPLSKKITSFVKIGFTGLEFESYNKYDIIVNEGSGNLESIKLKGESQGLKLCLGAKFIVSTSFSYGLSFGYNLYPKLNVKHEFSHEFPQIPSIDVKGFDFAITMSFINK